MCHRRVILSTFILRVGNADPAVEGEISMDKRVNPNRRDDTLAPYSSNFNGSIQKLGWYRKHSLEVQEKSRMLNAFFTCYFSSRYVVVPFILIPFYPSPQITRERAGLSNRTFLIDVTALYVLQQP